MKNARVTPVFPEEGKNRWVFIHFLTLTSEDIADISAALIAEFPRMVFRVSRWDKQAELIDPEPAMVEARRVSRLPPQLRQPEFRFASQLTDYPEQSAMAGMLPPKDWTPIWEEQASGNFSISNHPAFTFKLIRSVYFSTASGRTSMHPRSPCGPDDAVQLRHGKFESLYNTADPLHGKFARRCKRIFFKYTTNRFTQVDCEGGAIRHRVERAETRVGFRALRWAAAHPRQFAGEDMKPYDWQPSPA